MYFLLKEFCLEDLLFKKMLEVFFARNLKKKKELKCFHLGLVESH